jgi:uncharacterized protein (DUF433 family)
MRITVEDILRWLASSMTFEKILYDFPELIQRDILTVLKFAADNNPEVSGELL